MAAQAEQAFARAFLNTINSQPIVYPDDFQQDPKDALRKVPVLPIPVPPPPKSSSSSSEPIESQPQEIELTIKSAKPAYTITLSIDPSESIAALKAHLATQPGAPPVDVQRLLLKGKALADTKLVREYDVKPGDTIHLMVRPGVGWDPSAPPPPTKPKLEITAPEPSSSLHAEPQSTSSRKHSRIPSVVLSPSPSIESEASLRPVDIPLTLDSTTIPDPIPTETFSAQHAVLSHPDFWDKQLRFLRSEFKTEEDALLVFEDFFRASKGSLTASEIAKIRDTIGVVGMGGV